MALSPPPESPSSRGSGAAPAYASAPRRSGLLIAIACVVALAAAGALAMFLFGATVPTIAVPKAPSDDEKQAMAAAKAALDGASKSVLQPQGTSAPPQDAAPPAAADAPKADVASAPPPAPAVEPPRMAVAPQPAAARPASKADPAKSATRAAPAPKAPAPADPVVVAAVPAPATPPAANADRWAQMKAELAQCSGSSVLGLQCERRVRVRYCEGYWGSVPECSTGRTDHGN